MPIPPRDLLVRFQAAIEDRRQREEQLAQFAKQDDPELASLQLELKEAEARHLDQITRIESEYEQARQAAISLHAEETSEAHATAENNGRQIARSLDAEAATLEQEHSDSAWVVSSVLDRDSDDSPLRQHDRYLAATGRSRDEQTALFNAMSRILGEAADRHGRRLRTRTADPVTDEDPDVVLEKFNRAIREGDSREAQLQKLLLPRLLVGWRSVWMLGLLFVVSSLLMFFLGSPQWLNLQGGRWDGPWIGASAVFGFLVTIVLGLLLYTFAGLARSDVFQHWEQSLADARVAYERWGYLIARDVAIREPQARRFQQEMERKRQGTLERYRETFETRMADIRQRREQLISAEQHTCRQRLAAADQQRDAALAAAEAQFESARQQEESRSYAEVDHLKSAIAERLAGRQREQSAIWSTLKTGWERAMSDFWSEVEEGRTASDDVFLPWAQLADPQAPPPTTIPGGLRLGSYDLHFERWPGALSSDMRLAPRTTAFQLPAVLPFPERPSLLLKSRTAEGRAAALPILQSAMLRLLTLLPPGTVRFTIFDPVGLGDSFAGFMHLADVDELLVTTRIWTEPGQIEARLADLTEHMENVLQTYLRNEFPTLEDYNRHAGEVAEPYRIVVVRDFPAKFSEVAARRLTSIITSGPRCGVYTLMSLDSKLQLPNNFHLADLEAAMNVFEWKTSEETRESEWSWIDPAPQRGRSAEELLEIAPGNDESPTEVAPPAFHSIDPVLAHWPLIPDPPPEPEVFSQIVKRAGAASKNARRVEVSFERIAPSPAELWSQDSRHGIDVPMGRAGAVKLQHVRLGQGTSQHMLIAGKTGSGKSTFLHGLITNLALHYSPDELQFFLIDFKKGVEFKDYATFQLPHARVIAIESDREFGVSALTRLDELMQERGELFRRSGVQNVAGFRAAQPQTPLPRILLVIDEFQEFFTEDDRYSQTAGLLLDRLVRQGRAFGIHVILGSQTLGGAYSLARSTLGQVAVRVALQCSEADAHLILSEENTAARLLTRPGEAIYNDANGLVEGNHPFQIAWLPDDQREVYLRDLQIRGRDRGRAQDPPIVFEGNLPSDLSRNTALRNLIEQDAPLEKRITAPKVWLGDAVEIGDPTSLQLERHAGSNLLIAGQEPDVVQGLFAAAISAIALQHAASGDPNDGDSATDAPILWLFDGSPADDPARRHWADLQHLLGNQMRLVSPANAAAAVTELDALRQQREAASQELAPTVAILVYNLSRFRDLRRAEDDFGLGGFGGQDQPASPSKQFAQLLTGGPELGLHSLIWADSYNNVERWFSRQMLRDFELRLLFPMNAADSSNLIDSPLASRLGPGRAILYREDRGSTEKFRPYAVPGPEFQEALARRLRSEPDLELATDLEGFSVL